MRKLIRGFFVISFLFLVSCTSSKNNGGISVVTTSNPNYNLVKYIAQGKVDVHNLIFDSDSHNFEVKPEDVRKIEDANVIFYNGLSLDDKVLDFSKDKDKFVRTTEGTELIKIGNNNESKESYDPHVWLSLKEYKVMGKNVLDKLIEIDPQNKDFYTKNYNDFVERADNIYNNYKRDFENLINREFISNHASYGYLSRDFSLINSSIYDINNHGEANPQNIQAIIDVIKQKNIKLIVGDEFDSNKELETILNETGVNYKEVNNLESKGDFFTEYEKLLSSIYDGLK